MQSCSSTQGLTRHEDNSPSDLQHAGFLLFCSVICTCTLQEQQKAASALQVDGACACAGAVGFGCGIPQDNQNFLLLLF